MSAPASALASLSPAPLRGVSASDPLPRHRVEGANSPSRPGDSAFQKMVDGPPEAEAQAREQGSGEAEAAQRAPAPGPKGRATPRASAGDEAGADAGAAAGAGGAPGGDDLPALDVDEAQPEGTAVPLTAPEAILAETLPTGAGTLAPHIPPNEAAAAVHPLRGEGGGTETAEPESDLDLAGGRHADRATKASVSAEKGAVMHGAKAADSGAEGAGPDLAQAVSGGPDAGAASDVPVAQAASPAEDTIVSAGDTSVAEMQADETGLDSAEAPEIARMDTPGTGAAAQGTLPGARVQTVQVLRLADGTLALARPQIEGLAQIGVTATPGAIEVQLAPAELGPLHLSLGLDGDVLRVTVTAERPETLDLMRRHSADLAAEFRALGYSGAAFSFAHGRPGGGGEGGRAQTTDGGPEGHAPSEGARASLAAARVAATSRATGLDIRL